MSLLMKQYRDKRDAQRTTIQEKYNILGFISSGTYGKVYKAHTHTLSQIGKANLEENTQLNREIHHENLTALQEVVLQDKSIYLVFEYCEHDFLVRTIVSHICNYASVADGHAGSCSKSSTTIRRPAPASQKGHSSRCCGSC